MGKRVRKPVKDVQMLDDDYDSEDDESFNDEGSRENSDEEEEVASGDQSDDVSMAESDLGDEVKELQKNAPVVSGRRRGDQQPSRKADSPNKNSKKDQKKKKE